jgi:hypothetical protein
MIKNQCRREIWRTSIINTISHVDKIKCDCATRRFRIDRDRVSWEKIEFVWSRLKVLMRMHYWFKSSNFSARLMSLFFKRRFKKRRQHEFCSFEWWTSVFMKFNVVKSNFFTILKFDMSSKIVAKWQREFDEFIMNFQNQIDHVHLQIK